MTSRITAYRKLLFVRNSNKERESPHLRAAQGKGIVISGSLTLCFPLDFHNPLQHSPLRLIFLSNFKIFLVIVCHCVV